MKIDPKILNAGRSLIRAGDLTGFMLFMKGNPSHNYIISIYGTWLHMSARFGQYEIVRYLVLDANININQRGGTFGGTALNEAAASGYCKIVKFLLSHGAVMEVEEPEMNPLFNAINGGYVDVVRFLIGNGVDTSVRYYGPSMKGMDAASFALEQGRTEIYALLK